jgi:hypothetical protein
VIFGFIIRYLPIFLGALRLASLLGVSYGLTLLIDFYTFYSFFIKCSFTFINFILTQQNEAFTVMRYIFTAQRYNHQESVTQTLIFSGSRSSHTLRTSATLPCSSSA